MKPGPIHTLALRLLFRACKAVAELSGIPITAAPVGAFAAAWPGVTHIRDVTEHFDEYIQGKGDRKGAKMPMHSYTSGIATHLIQVPVFGADGVLTKMHVIDVARCSESARVLAAAVL
jgi:hypothetical protein